MVAMGLVRRRRLLSDRRVVILTLTDEGLTLTQDLNERVQAYDARLCEGVSEEQMAILTVVVARVMANHVALTRSGQV